MITRARPARTIQSFEFKKGKTALEEPVAEDKSIVQLFGRLAVVSYKKLLFSSNGRAFTMEFWAKIQKCSISPGLLKLRTIYIYISIKVLHKT